MIGNWDNRCFLVPVIPGRRTRRVARCYAAYRRRARLILPHNPFARSIPSTSSCRYPTPTHSTDMPLQRVHSTHICSPKPTAPYIGAGFPTPASVPLQIFFPRARSRKFNFIQIGADLLVETLADLFTQIRADLYGFVWVGADPSVNLATMSSQESVLSCGTGICTIPPTTPTCCFSTML